MFTTNEIIAVNLIVIVWVALNYQQTLYQEMFTNVTKLKDMQELEQEDLKVGHLDHILI